MKFIHIYISLIIIISFSCKKSNKQDFNQKVSLNSEDSIVFYRMLDSLSHNYSENDDSLLLFVDNIALRFPNYIAEANIKIAHIHFSQGNYFLAEHCFSNAAQEFLNNSLKEKYAEQLSNIGVVKEVSGDYSGALEKYFEALSVFKQLKLDFKISMIYNNLGVVYQQLKEDDKSLSYYKKSLKISEELGKFNISARRYNNIATHYEEFDKDLDSALLYYKKAYNVFIKDTNSLNLPIVENNMGNIYMLQKDFKNADSLFNSALNYSKKRGLNNIISPILTYQAQLLLLKNDFKNSILKAEEAIALSRKNANKENELDALGVLVKCFENNNDFINAYKTLKEYYTIQEELSGIEQKKQINTLNVQYNVREKETEIQILELENTSQSRELWQMLTLLTVLLILLVVLFFMFRLQKKNNNLQIERMQHDIAEYINEIRNIKEESKQEIEKNTKINNEEILQKLKQFGLTEREEEVLLLISEGYKNDDIAKKMFVSINTIKTHAKNIFIKLDVKNRIQAAKKAKIL